MYSSVSPHVLEFKQNCSNQLILTMASDELNPDPPEHVEPDPQDSNSDSDMHNDIRDNLVIDLDNLLQDGCSLDEMFDILNGDPEWTDSEFVDIHVRHFIGPTGSNFPPHFDVEVASPIDYFQLFFSDDVFQTIYDNTNKFQKFCVTQK